MPTNPLKYHLLHLLQERLEAEGHSLGIDQHLRLQELLQSLPDDWPPERLKTILCPLLASDKQSQKDIYEYFDEALEAARAIQGTPEEKQTYEAVRENRWRWVAWILGGLLAITAALFFFLEKEAEVLLKNHTQYLTLQDSTSQIVSINNDTLREQASDILFEANTGNNTYSTELVDYEKLDSLQLRLTPKVDTNARDSITLLLPTKTGDTLLWHLVPTLTYQQTFTVSRQTDSLFRKQSLPYPDHDIRDLAVQEPTAWEINIRRWLFTLKILALVLLAGFLWAIMRWREFRRRKLIAEMEQRNKPPYVWNIRFPETAEPDLGENFNLILNRMRQRTGNEAFQLDIPKTIGATIERGGMVDFQYRQQTRPPEYLLLIDRQSAANHRAHLFDTLYQAFREQEVLVHRFFFDGDVRLCFNEEYPDGIQLPDLSQRYPGTRLLVVSSGHALLSNMSGKLSSWTELFKRWKERALLSPMAIDTWGRRERQLGELFVVLPASLQGLNFLITQLDDEEDADFSGWSSKVTDAPLKAFRMDVGLIRSLEEQFSEPILRWIAACAVYPDMSYQLTCHLGQLLSTPDQPLLSIRNLSELNLLPWFVEGQMPQSVRALLLEYLEEKHPDTLLQVRQFLHSLLSRQENTPPPESSAAADHQMQLALNEWLFTKDKARKKALEKEIAQLMEAGVEADFTVVKFLNRERSPLDFVVPDAWKKYLDNRGWSLSSLKDLYWTIPIFLVAAFFIFKFQLPPLEECRGEEHIYQDLIICLETRDDFAIYSEFLIRDAIEMGDLDDIDDLIRTASWNILDSTDLSNRVIEEESILNVGAKLYNKGVNLHLSDRDSACLYFNRANTLRSPYGITAARWCADANLLIADFSFEEEPFKCAPYELRIKNNSLNATTFSWDFGDGGSGPLNNVISDFTHTFLTPGTYTIQLTAGRGLARDTISKTIEIQDCITGQLLAADSKRPIPNAEVRAADTGRITDAGLPRLDPVFTNTNGQFVLEGLSQANILQMLVSAESFQDTILRLRKRSDLGILFLERIAPALPPIQDTIPNQQTAPPEQRPPIENLDISKQDIQISAPEMVYVAGDTFEMGDQFDDGYNNEKPVHSVTLDNYYIGRYEVTFDDYDAFCESTGREKPADKGWGRGRRPVINVSWLDAIDYCNWLSEQLGYTPVYNRKGESVIADWSANGFRLPTEAEWEFAARQRGQKVRFGNGKDVADPAEINFDGSEDYKEDYSTVGVYRGQTVEVGSLQSPNDLGLHDMSGNVYEWCWDWYSEYSPAPQTNPTGPENGSYRVLRGGSWYSYPIFVRCANRRYNSPGNRYNDIGFRLSRAGR